MQSAVAWIGLPLVLLLAAAGVGLALERLLRRSLPDGLLAPVGACGAIAVTLPVYKLGASAPMAAVLLAALAMTGLALSRRGLPRRLGAGWAGVAGLAAYGLYLAPVVLTGHWTWLGYNFVNDTAVNLVMTDHVARHGVRLLDQPSPSTTASIIQGTLGTSYPMGIHALLATVAAYVPAPLEALYQPFIAALAAMTAMSLTVLARALSLPGVVAAGIGGLASGANLTFHYAGHGAFKEVAVAMMVAATAAVSREALDRRLDPATMALAGVCLAAALLVFAAAAAPYVAVFGLSLLAATALDRTRRPSPRRLLAAVAAGVGVVALGSLAGIDDVIAFGRVASEQYSGAGGLTGANSTSFLGHLVRPLPIYEAFGIWLRDDYRFPLAPGFLATATGALIVVAAVLAALSALVELRTRRLGIWLLVTPPLLVYLAAAPRLSPYAEAKLLVVLAPAAVFAAATGAWWLSRRIPVAGAAAGLALAFGVLGSDALAYHSMRVAPVERLESLAEAMERAPSDALVLAPEWEEWAKYYGRHRRINVASESFSPLPAVTREPVPVFARSFDLDDLDPGYVTQFEAILLRRAPDRSRPPAGYALAHRNRHYELWRRSADVRVREHLPFQGLHKRSGPLSCPDVRSMAARARSGDTLIGARRAPSHQLTYVRNPPSGWFPGVIPGTVTPSRPGDVSGSIPVRGGRHDVWVRGTSGRELEISVDGRRIGIAQGVNTPGQWLWAGTVDLSPGRHRVALLRGGGDFSPGDGHVGELGPVAFVPSAAEPRLVETDPADAERIFCAGKGWDWVERVR